MVQHGGAYRFVDDPGSQADNGLDREAIQFTGYGFPDLDVAPELMVVRDDSAQTRVFVSNADLLTAPEGGAARFDLATHGRDVQLYSRIRAGDGSAAPSNLAAVAGAMVQSVTDGTGSDIPAAYTYFGQFVAHDVSFLAWDDTAHEWVNRRAHGLALDSLFLAGTCPDASSQHCVRDQVGLGQAIPDTIRNMDIPRRANGAPCIADPRNDSNPGVSQMHVAVARFHHAVCAAFPALTPDQRRRITRQHVQQVVLFDYLKRIVRHDVWQSVIHHGRRIVAPAPITGGVFHVPVEFSVGCFRFGHSMVRSEYDHWRLERRKLNNLLYYAHNPTGDDGLGGNRQLLAWTPDWSRMLPDDPSPQMSGAIGPKLAGRLGALERWRFLTPPGGALPVFVNLAEMSLLRGYEVNLPSAQALGAQMAGQLGMPVNDLVMESAGIFSPTVPGLAPLMAATGLDLATPLWLYTLIEAERNVASGERGLGPLAGRIVMETLHAAVEAAPDSIVAGYVDGAPQYHFGGEMADGGDFTLASLISIGTGAPNLCA